MPKLYEILFRKAKNVWSPPKPEVQEEKIYNPIKGRIGGSMTIDLLGYRGLSFVVNEIKEYHVHDMKFSDYLLIARPFDKPDVTIRLRLIPTNNAGDDISHRILLLNLYHEQGFDKGLLEVLNDQSKKFVVDDTKNDDDPTNDTHEEYYRVNDVGVSLVAQVKTLIDRNNDGKVDANEIKENKIEFWDYSRNATIDGLKLEQFLFVELDKETEWFQMWQGTEVNPDRVEAI